MWHHSFRRKNTLKYEANSSLAALLPEWGESATAFSSPIEATSRAAMWEAYADPAGSDRATIKGDAVDIWSEHRRMVQGRDHR